MQLLIKHGYLPTIMPEASKIQIAQIMVHRATPGQAACQKAAILLQLLHMAFSQGILIAPDNYCVLILPQVQVTLPRLQPLQKHRFQRQIAMGIIAVTLNYE